MMAEREDALRFPLPYLKAWRRYAVLSQQQLAKRAGIVRGTIIRLEQGELANSTTVHKLAKGLDISVQQLLHENPDETKKRVAA
jgi:DNA-binding XRE family transcriptional regulator